MNSTSRSVVCLLAIALAATFLAAAARAAPVVSPVRKDPVLGEVQWTFHVDPASGRPLSSGNRLDLAAADLCAVTAYRNLPSGSAYTYEWSHNGVLIRQGGGTVAADAGHIVECHQWIVGAMEFVLRADGQMVKAEPFAVVPALQPTESGTVRCGPLRFSGAYGTGDGYTPTDGVRFATGTHDLVAAWRCVNAPVGTAYRISWMLNGKPLAQREARFEQAVAGFWEPLPAGGASALAAGTYRLALDVADEPVLVGEFVLEGFGGFSSRPSFGQIAFAGHFDERAQQPLDVMAAFNAGTTAVYAYVPYRGLRRGTTVRVTWTHDGQPFSLVESTLEASQGLLWTKAVRPDLAPLPPGTYRVVLAVGGETVLAEDVAVSSAPAAQKQFGPLVFASAIDETTSVPLDPGFRFPYGTTMLYALWPYRDVTPGTSFNKKWYFNEALLSEGQGTLDLAADTMWNRLYDAAGVPLDAGPYMLQLEIGAGQGWLVGRCMIAAP